MTTLLSSGKTIGKGGASSSKTPKITPKPKVTKPTPKAPKKAPKTTTAPPTQQPTPTIDSIKQQADALQKSLNDSIASGEIPTSKTTPTTPTTPTTTPKQGVDTNYFIKPGESAQAYQTRVDAYNASKSTTPTTPDVGAPPATPATPGVGTTTGTPTGTQTGTQDTGTYTTNPDGSLTYVPQTAPQTTPQTPPSGSTTQPGGYVQINGAYFQQAPDGLRAVTDKNVITGLKNGTIPHANTGIEGKVFSPYVVPYTDPARQKQSDQALRDQGYTPESDKIGQHNTTPPAPLTHQVDQFGLTTTQSDFLNDPKKAISDMTSSILSQMGYGKADKEITNSTKDLEKLKNQQDDEIQAVNDNPWTVEGIKLRQVESIKTKYENRISNATERLKLLENVKQDALDASKFAIGTAVSLWDKERQYQQDQINYYSDQAQRQFDNQIKLQNLDTKSQGTNDMQEYLLAVKQGFKGNFIDYKRAMTVATDKTPDTESTTGQDLIDGFTYVKNNPSKYEDARRTFLSKHPGDSTKWDNFFPDGADTFTQPASTQSTTQSSNTGLFGWGFLGL